ncbi:MAG: hypothetical protein ABFR62_12080 [Bacteroidota bacterium]
MKSVLNNISTKLLLILVIINLGSCRKIQSYPPEPIIKFESGYFTIEKDTLENNILYYNSNLNFTDGDGNVGWEASEEKPDAQRPCDVINTHDLYVNLFEEIDGEFVKRKFVTDYHCVNDTLTDSLGVNVLHANLPYMLGRGQANSLIGNIEYKIELPSLRSKTIKFDFQLCDRDNNYSEIIESPVYGGVEPPEE